MAKNLIVFTIKPNKRLYVPESELAALVRVPQVVDHDLEEKMRREYMRDVIRRAEVKNPAPTGFARVVA